MGQYSDGYMYGWNSWRPDIVYNVPQPRHGNISDVKLMTQRWKDGHACGWHERKKQKVFPGMSDDTGVFGAAIGSEGTSVRVNGADEDLINGNTLVLEQKLKPPGS